MSRLNRLRTLGGLRGRALSGSVAAFDPLDLFGAGDDGLHIDFRAGTVFEDAAKTTAATDDADVLGAAADRNGNYDATQGTAANKPLLQLAEVASGPAAQFDGTNDYLSLPLTSIAPPMTLAISLKTPASIAAAVNLRISTDSTGIGFSLGLNPTASEGLALYSSRTASGDWTTGVPLASLSTNTWYLWLMVFSGTTMVSYLDGTEKDTINFTSAVSPSAQNLGYPYSGAFGNYWNSFFREVFWINRAITAGERASLTTYMLANIGK